MKKFILVIAVVVIVPQSVWSIWYRTYATNGKYGYMESSERDRKSSTAWKIQPVFEDCAFAITEGGISAAKSGGKWGYVNDQGTFVIPAVFDEVPVEDISGYELREKNILIAVCYRGNWGVIDTEGNMVIPPYYEKIGFSILEHKPGYPLTVYQDSVAHYVDITGEPLIVTSSHEGADAGCIGMAGERQTMLFPVKKDGRWGYVNIAGTWIMSPEMDAPVVWDTGYAIIAENGGYGVMDYGSRILVEPVYDRIETMVNYYGDKWLTVSRNGRYGAITPDGAVIVPVNKKSRTQVSYKKCNKYVIGHRNELKAAESERAALQDRFADELRSLYTGKTHEDSLKAGAFYKFVYSGETDPQKAMYWLNRSAWMGYASSQNNLGAMLFNGENLPWPDYDHAFVMFAKAADSGNVNAIKNMGLCYITGNGTAYDFCRAIDCYAMAMALEPDSEEVMESFGKCYMQAGTQCGYQAAEFFYLSAGDAEKADECRKLAAEVEAKNAENMPHFTVLHKDVTITEAMADAYNSGLDYLESGQYSSAYACFKRASDMGLTKADEQIAGMYIEGYDGFTDMEGRLYWCKRFARSTGYPPIYAYIGNLYFEEGDYQEMMRWIVPAAEAGAADAVFRLGYCYHYGTGADIDLEKAESYYKEASEKGVVEAKNNLALLYSDTERYDEAQKMWAEAADQGYVTSMVNYAAMLSEMEQMESCYLQAMQYLIAAAVAGSAKAQYDMSLIYSDDCSPWNEDLREKASVFWLKKAVSSGYAEAYGDLGMRYFYGDGIEKDDTKAFELVSLGAACGDPYSMLDMSIFYVLGTGQVEKDEDKAREWYEKASSADVDLGVQGEILREILY